MRGRRMCALVVIVGVSCTSAAPPGSGRSVSTAQVAWVDLIEAGIRAVTSPSRLSYEAIPAGRAPIDHPGRDYVFVGHRRTTVTAPTGSRSVRRVAACAVTAARMSSRSRTVRGRRQ